MSGISVTYGKVKLLIPSTVKLRAYAGSQSEADFRSVLIQRGPILISKQGLTGPAILRLSSYGAKVLAAIGYKCTIEISWMGELDSELVLSLLQRDKQRYSLRKIGKACPAIDRKMLLALTQDDPAYSDAYDLKIYDDHLQLEKEEEESGITGNSNDVLDDPAGQVIVVRRRLWRYLLQRSGISPELRWCDVPNTSLEILAKEITQCKFEIDGKFHSNNDISE